MKQKRYSFGKQLLSMLLVMVLLLSGITVPVKADNSQKEQVNAKEQPYVYFQYDDGRIQEMGEDNTFTLNLLDTGNFVLAGTDNVRIGIFLLVYRYQTQSIRSIIG